MRRKKGSKVDGWLILDKPVVLPTYGELAPLNTIDTLGNKGSATFTVSGYGITTNSNTAAPASCPPLLNMSRQRRSV